MLAKQAGVLAVGSVIIDLLCRVPRLPSSGEGVISDGFQVAVGGCAFNSANVIRQLQAPVLLLAPVGVGFYAGFAQRELSARGFDAFRVPACEDGVARDNGACLCFVEPDGQRTMVTVPGLDRHFSSTWFDQVDPARFSCGFACGYEIEGQGGDAIIGFFERHPEILLYYAPGPRVANVGARKAARINALHPVWHLNDQEALAYTGCAALDEAGSAIARASGNAVVVTAGGEGAHLFEGDRHIVVPTDPASVADSVGAGDAHLGALVAARNAGKSWSDALMLANRVAGAVCQVEGSTLADDAFARLGVRL